MASIISSDQQTVVSFADPKNFGTKLNSGLKETLFPDDPLSQFRNEPAARRPLRAIKYFIPIFEWLPKYSLLKLRYDVLAGITLVSLAIPQGISYAKLADLPPIIGLYSSVVPPIIYAIFGNSNYLAVGNVAACSLLIAETIGEVASPTKDTNLYISLVFTSAFVTGVFQSALGFLRLGILVDFLSHSTVLGFMGGTAILIILQQFKGMLGMKTFTTRTDVVHVLTAVFKNRKEWRWESAVVGIVFLLFLESTKFLRRKKPKLFWVSAISPIAVVIAGGIFAFIIKGDEHGIRTVGPLKKGINPLSIRMLVFDSKYFTAVAKAGIITGVVALAEGIAIGRSFAIMRNEYVDGNKEMVAFGLMNIVGSFFSSYLTTGPFSKTAVNFNAGAKTPITNLVMAACMALVLLFLAPLFSHTPLVALSAIIMSAMLGLIKYEEVYHIFKVDKFDFLICMAAFFGVSFWSMDMGILISVALAILRALLYVARPASCKLEKIQNTTLYRDTQQYPNSVRLPRILVLQPGSPIYYANANYVRDRTLRWIREEQEQADTVNHVLFELSGVTAIDMTGIETLIELRRTLNDRGIKIMIVNPRIGVMEKLIASHFVDTLGKENFFLSVEDAVQACQFLLEKSNEVDLRN